MLRKNFKILKRRLRTAYAEIDIIAESSQAEIWLIEVKTLGNFDFFEKRVSKRQKERLQRAYIYLQAKTQKRMRLVFAFVDRQGKILTIENI